MQVILIAIGSAGDVYPFIGLGRALLQRGHGVTLCSMPVFQSAIEQQGLDFVSVCDEQTYQQAMADPKLWDPKTSFPRLWEAIAQMLEPVYRYVTSRRHEDILVVGSLWALGARVAQERHGIAYLSVQVSPSTLLSAHLPPVHPSFNVPASMPLIMRQLLWRGIEYLSLDRVCAPAIDRLRHQVGLKGTVQRVFSKWLHSPDGVLCLFPSWFAEPQADWPQPLTMSGFPLFDGVGDIALDAELTTFLQTGTAPVVFTQGSTTHVDPRFYAIAQRALTQLGLRGVFLTGNREPLEGLPATILQRPFVPMGSLLPQCAALVHPAGIGAMSLALACGIPQIAVPVAHDQFDNAARLVRLGAGLSLAAPLVEADVLTALKRVINDHGIVAACKQLQSRTAPPTMVCDVAVDLMERCHGRHQPAALKKAG
jgi:rhamnosyltransferase subunit B